MLTLRSIWLFKNVYYINMIRNFVEKKNKTSALNHLKKCESESSNTWLKP
jgi:hypothetical protein